MNLQEVRLALQQQLAEKGIETPGNVSLILLGHILHQDKAWVLTHGEYLPTLTENQTLQSSLEKLLQGMPLPYILGEWEFFGRRFEVTPAVLIPRPETELLVERAVQFAAALDHPRVVDVGCGSGIIAVTLAKALPEAHILALDVSRPALEIARLNAVRHQVRLDLLQADLLKPLSGPFNLICANLPYIPTAALDNLEVTHWEPRLALDGGESGLVIISRLLSQAQTRLAPGGSLLLEIEATLGQKSLTLANTAFPDAKIQLFSDLAGKDRLIQVQVP
ncbi:MAG: peptide chain release factor N(5)-glutamine methyltransferase [Anaerolineaceae bacterium]|nr:peptide chain release factor N(5)-glutamine methyltransferase [Anaerolineaceae bacterium]